MHEGSRLFRTLCGAACLVSALTAGLSPALGQTPPADGADPSQTEVFFESIDVELVNIDVWVTDRRGSPVAGLSKDDFIVTRDGTPVDVANFYAVRGPGSVDLDGRSEVDAAPDVSVDPLRDESPTGDGEAIPSVHRLWVVLYFDNYNLDPVERNRILPSVRRFLSRNLKAGDRTMVVSYDRALEVRQPFTDDKELLYVALAELIDESGHVVVRRRDQVQTLRLIDRARSASQAMGYARQYAEEQKDGVERTAEALGQLIDSLAGLPGRKALVYVSSGVPMAAGEEMFHAVAEKFGAAEAYSQIPRHDTARSFEQVDRQANEQRVAFYTVDAGGLRVMEFGTAEYGGFVNPRLRRTLDSVVPENLQSPLRLMALETGGQAILNQNEVLAALEKATRDFSSFYSLGILADAVDTGRFHEIEVKLRAGRGLNVRHRGGYRSKDIETRTEESLRSALLYAHADNPLGVDVAWGRSERSGESANYVLPIRLRIPLRDVVPVPIGRGRQEIRLRLFVGAVDERGDASAIDSAPLGVRLADEHVEAARKEALLHNHRLLLKPGRNKVGVAVLDRVGRQVSVVTGVVQVGPVADDG